MKYLLIILLLLIGCSDIVDTPDDVVWKYKQAYFIGGGWVAIMVANGDVVQVGQIDSVAEVAGCDKKLYRDSFRMGAIHCLNYVATDTLSEDDSRWLYDRVEFIKDSLGVL